MMYCCFFLCFFFCDVNLFGYSRDITRKNWIVMCKNLRECRSFDNYNMESWRSVIKRKEKNKEEEKSVFVNNRAKWKEREELVAFGVESGDSVCSNYIETMSVIILKIERQYEQFLCADDLIKSVCIRIWTRSRMHTLILYQYLKVYIYI